MDSPADEEEEEGDMLGVAPADVPPVGLTVALLIVFVLTAAPDPVAVVAVPVAEAVRIVLCTVKLGSRLRGPGAEKVMSVGLLHWMLVSMAPQQCHSFSVLLNTTSW